MKILVIQPGGYHPFHTGHQALYDSAKAAFPGADVFVAATDDTSTRPFPFVIKQKLAQLAGVPANRFVKVKSPFRAEEITQGHDPDNTVLIFVRSEKDRASPPRPGGTKRDGTPSYLQPMSKQLKPMSQHAYMAYLPTVEFGPGLTSATEIRKTWPGLNDRRKTAMVMSLYPATQSNPGLAQTVVKMLDTAIGSELNEQPNQAGVGAGTAVAANTQPQTNTASTAAAPTSAPSVGTVSATPAQPSAGTTAASTAATTAAAPAGMQPNSNVANLARRLGVDPKRLQGELQNMQEDYLDEKRH